MSHFRDDGQHNAARAGQREAIDLTLKKQAIIALAALTLTLVVTGSLADSAEGELASRRNSGSSSELPDVAMQDLTQSPSNTHSLHLPIQPANVSSPPDKSSFMPGTVDTNVVRA